ncbi:hypothetical protein [Frankia sp. Cj3]|uniref:hypothetical protein n=1 Tax=Frankia sp. Cj3 TaxID=2880976 RepID=UPI001EF6E21A|nr:hypothetical protein [Frankia sp. Cj3]
MATVKIHQCDTPCVKPTIIKYIFVSAIAGDRVPGIEISDPDCPVTWDDLPQEARRWARTQGYGGDEGELLYVLTPGQDVPDGHPSLAIEMDLVRQ